MTINNNKASSEDAEIRSGFVVNSLLLLLSLNVDELF